MKRIMTLIFSVVIAASILMNVGATKVFAAETAVELSDSSIVSIEDEEIPLVANTQDGAEIYKTQYIVFWMVMIALFIIVVVTVLYISWRTKHDRLLAQSNDSSTLTE